jgi:hypothetical protein
VSLGLGRRGDVSLGCGLLGAIAGCRMCRTPDLTNSKDERVGVTFSNPG